MVPLNFSRTEAFLKSKYDELVFSMRYDMTGHADGMVRFIDENTVIGNRVPGKNSLEKRIASILQDNGIHTTEFPYFDSKGISAEGCYLNFL